MNYSCKYYFSILFSALYALVINLLTPSFIDLALLFI
ncbi:ABC transporter domain-containing protein [Psidium guajava]|nr:ABC transporter domain-containing protein [Psidium guajava]